LLKIPGTTEIREVPNMRRLLPSRRSGGWFCLGVVWALLLTAGLWLHPVLHGQWSPDVAARTALTAIGQSALVHAAGWFGWRWLWGCGIAGAAIGVALLHVYAASDMAGWEDLIGVMALMFVTLIGLAAGLLAEVASATWKWYKRKNRPPGNPG
jgi:hypothetical protein